MSDPAQSILDHVAEGLREPLAQAERRERELQAQIEAVRDQRRRLERAMAALTGEQKPRGRPAKKKGDTNAWMPSEKIRSEVLGFVEMHPDGVTVKEATQGTSVSHTGVDRTLRVLRNEQEIRLAGKRGTALVYKPKLERGSMNGA